MTSAFGRPGVVGGLAVALLSRSFTVRRDRGLPYVWLDIDADATTGAVRLHASVGTKQPP